MSLTRCSLRSFLCGDAKLGLEGDGVIFLLTVRCSLRYSFVYLSSTFSMLCFNSFCRALFVLAVFYANSLFFQLFRKFFASRFSHSFISIWQQGRACATMCWCFRSDRVITLVHGVNSPGPEVFVLQLGHQRVHIVLQCSYLPLEIRLAVP